MELMLFAVVTAMLLLSAFFSGSEAALMTLTDADVETMVRQKLPGSAMLERVKRSMAKAVITIVIMNNVVNIAGSVIVGQMTNALYGSAALALTTTVLTFAVIIFSEIAPKNLGIHYAHMVAPLVAGPVYILTMLLYPVILLFETIMNLFLRGERKVGTEEQIRSLVSIGRREGHIENDEGQLIHRAFILNDKTAGQIMVPAGRIISVTVDTVIRDAAKKVFHETYSRYPVFGDSIHDVRGLVMSQDILEALSEGRDDAYVGTILRDVITVDVHDACDELLFRFRDRHIHLAVVQEEGKTVGLVTLEDVLEELVGEIEDEFDAQDRLKASGRAPRGARKKRPRSRP